MADAIEGPYTVQHSPPFRTGLVSAVQITPFPACRVTFPDRDNIESYWLQVVYPTTGVDKFFWLPKVGDQVKVSMDEHDEYGSIDGCVYSQGDAPPDGVTVDQFGVWFSDGAIFVYDKSNSTFSLSLADGGTIVITQPSGGSITIDDQSNIEVVGTQLVSIKASGTINLQASSIQLGASPIDSFVLVTKLIEAFNIHTHSDPPTTGPPTIPLTPPMLASELVSVEN